MLKKNTVASYLGTGWATIMAIAFVPIYVKHLGLEAYGLISLLAIMHAWMGLADLGMASAVNREMARYTKGVNSSDDVNQLLTTLSIVAIGIATIAIGIIYIASPVLARTWVNSEAISTQTISVSLTMMGAIVALRIIEGLYRASLIGMQRLVVFNILQAGLSTIRSVGAVFIVIYISPRLEVFFLWQLTTAILSVFLMAGVTYKFLPRQVNGKKFSFDALRRVWKFAGGSFLAMALAAILSQIDKVILSATLTLESFGVYSLAATISIVILALTGPLSTAIYPRMTAALAVSDIADAERVFHRGTQALSVIVGTLTIILIAFSKPLITAWTHDIVLAKKVSEIFTWLAFGNLCASYMQILYYSQLAHSNVKMTVYVNAAILSVMVPSIVIVAPRFGALGAAHVWAAVNAIALILGSSYVFRSIFIGEKYRWYINDIFKPMFPTMLVVAIFWWAKPNMSNPFVELIYIFCVAIVAGATALMMTSHRPTLRRS